MRRALALAILAHLLLIAVLTAVVQLPDAPGGPALEIALRAADTPGTGVADTPAPPADRPPLVPDSAAGTAAPPPPLPQPAPANLPLPNEGITLAPAASLHIRSQYIATLSRHMQSRPFLDPRRHEQLRAQNVEGTAVVTIRIDRDGNIVTARISASSGNAILDAAALDAVRARSPVPKPPPEMDVDNIDWDWPVPYRLQ